MFTIVGLGNPGRSYERNRHNVGLMAADAIAGQSARWSTKGKALLFTTEICEKQVRLVKPQTYMNLSGHAVVPLLRMGSDGSDLIVVHDDLDLPLGRVRLKQGGGDGGHRGIRSIADSLRFRDFIRVRLGIGRPPEGIPADVYVLQDFELESKIVLNELIDRGCDAVRLIVSQGLEPAKAFIHAQKESARI